MTNFAVAKDGVRLAYEIVGNGTDTILLVHGFGSSRAQNWRDTSWYDTLSRAGLSVIAMDCRGHGESDKPHTPQGYRHDEMASDLIAVLDDAGVARADVMGYSMGGFIAIHLLVGHPERVSRLIVGGVGENYLDPPGVRRDRVADPEVRTRIVEALQAADPSRIADPVARRFRAFADQPGKDRLALAACMSAPTVNLPAAVLATAQRPVLVVCGENDDLTGKPDGLAAAFPNGRAVTVPRRDHMTAVGDKVYKVAVVEFIKF